DDGALEVVASYPQGGRGGAAAFFGHEELFHRALRSGSSLTISAESGDPAERDLLERAGGSFVALAPLATMGPRAGVLLIATSAAPEHRDGVARLTEATAAQLGQALALIYALERRAAAEGRSRALMENANDGIVV